jgi:hypothetical protein
LFLGSINEQQKRFLHCSGPKLQLRANAFVKRVGALIGSKFEIAPRLVLIVFPKLVEPEVKICLTGPRLPCFGVGYRLS